jgi:hypothetical protein
MNNVITHPAFARAPVANARCGAGRYPKAVDSLDSARARRNIGKRRVAHEQVLGDPDPPSARIWLQGGEPKASLQNITPDSVPQILVLALSLCIELAILAQEGGRR